MRSPGAAIAWELRQRHGLALLVLGAYLVCASFAWAFLVEPYPPVRLEPPDGRAATLIAPFSMAFMYLLAVFSFGLEGDLAARRSMYPARFFTLPATTTELAGWPMLLGGAMAAGLWLIAACFAHWWWYLDPPWIWPGLLAAVFLAWTQVLTWSAYGLPGLRIVTAVLWLGSLDVAVVVAVKYEIPEPRLVAFLLPQLLLAFLAARLVVARARRGDVPDWRRLSRLARAARATRRFSSPSRAQVWFEWRREGWILPLTVAMVLPFELCLLGLARHEPVSLVFGTLGATLLTPPFMAGFAGAVAGRGAGDASGTRGAPFAATRPLSSAALVAAKLEAALWSTLLTWLVLLTVMPLALWLTGTWTVVAARILEIATAVGTARAIVAALLALSFAIAWTWRHLVQSLCLHLSGHARVVEASVIARLSLLVVLFPALDATVRSGKAIAVLWDAWPWMLGLLVCLKGATAAWIAPQLLRRRALSERALVRGAATWLGVVLVLYLILVWLVSTPPLVGRYVPLLVAILAVPLARLSAAPLALSWSRHRGAMTADDDASPSAKRALRVARLLVGVPVALLLFESAAYAIRNRSNGAIVSSGQERGYLLHVPASYDAAKPTPLVISLHGGALWPAGQRDISEWDRLADSHGFIVVYPEGNGGWGRGPRAWHMQGSDVARNVRYISDLIDTLSASYNVDPARIYADGLSNGGGMAFVLSCRLSDRIAAVGLVASAQFLPFEWCGSEQAVPMIAIHGTADRAAPYHGGTSWASAGAVFPDIPAWTAAWSRRNRCRAAPVESDVAQDVTRLEYGGCSNDAAVVLYTVRDGGHSWPGAGPAPDWLVGRTSRSIDATSLMWSFYRQHRLAGRERVR